MFKIRDWLYISGYAVASNREVVKNKEIDVMLQLFEPIKISGIESLFLPIEDGLPISQDFIQQGVEFGLKKQKKGKILLVTCGKGISRSVTFSTAILKEVEGITLEDAYFRIRNKHHQALPDHIHWDSMRKYYGEGPEFWELWQKIVLADEDDI